MYLVLTRMMSESYRRRLRSLLCLCDVFQALINSLLHDSKQNVFKIQSVIIQTGWQLWNQSLNQCAQHTPGLEMLGHGRGIAVAPCFRLESRTSR